MGIMIIWIGENATACRDPQSTSQFMQRDPAGAQLTAGNHSEENSSVTDRL